MSKSQKKLPHTRLSFATTQKMKDELDKLAIKMNIPTSELIRRYIEQGMNVDKTKDDIDFIRKQIRGGFQNCFVHIKQQTRISQ